MAGGVASANAIMMTRESDLITDIATEAMDNAEAWEEQRLAGWDRARTVLDEIVIDATALSDKLQRIVEREGTRAGHAVTDAELAMTQNHREVLAMRLRVARRAQNFRNLVEDASGASQPAFTRYSHGAMAWDVASANAIMMTRVSDLIEGIATEARENAVAWEDQRLAGWERARTVLDDIVIDATLLTDMLQDILERENTGEGHAVTDIELAMAQNHRDVLAKRLRFARRAVNFRNLLEETSGASQPAFKKYRRGAAQPVNGDGAECVGSRVVNFTGSESTPMVQGPDTLRPLDAHLDNESGGQSEPFSSFSNSADESAEEGYDENTAELIWEIQAENIASAMEDHHSHFVPPAEPHVLDDASQLVGGLREGPTARTCSLR